MDNTNVFHQKLKKISISFILANVFDILTTMIALPLGLIEMNLIVIHFGWIPAIIVKFLGTIFAIYLLQITKDFWMFWIPVGFVWLVVVWNVLNIIMVFIP